MSANDRMPMAIPAATNSTPSAPPSVGCARRDPGLVTSGVSATPTRHLKASEMLRAAGPSTTTKSAGKMQNTIGISIFTGAFIARS